jgi:hypothetical protein
MLPFAVFALTHKAPDGDDDIVTLMPGLSLCLAPRASITSWRQCQTTHVTLWDWSCGLRRNLPRRSRPAHGTKPADPSLVLRAKSVADAGDLRAEFTSSGARMNCNVSLRSDYCPCMPANGDGTYDGAGGSAAQAAAMQATASRITKRLTVLMRVLRRSRSPRAILSCMDGPVISSANASISSATAIRYVSISAVTKF